MKNKEHPSTLFDQLALVKTAYETATRTLDEEDQIAVILEKAPTEYKAVLTSEQRHKGSRLTLEDLESAMNDHHRSLYSDNDGKNKN